MSVSSIRLPLPTHGGAWLALVVAVALMSGISYLVQAGKESIDITHVEVCKPGSSHGEVGFFCAESAEGVEDTFYPLTYSKIAGGSKIFDRLTELQSLRDGLNDVERTDEFDATLVKISTVGQWTESQSEFFVLLNTAQLAILADLDRYTVSDPVAGQD